MIAPETDSPAEDPLARIGRELVGAAHARRRHRRHAAQRAAGAVLTLAVLAGTAYAVRPFASDSAAPAGGQRVALDAGDGRFVVYRSGGGPVCADRPNGRDREGTTICAFPDLVIDLLKQPTRSAWVQARVVGGRVVVSGLAAVDARIVVTAPLRGGGAGERVESKPGGPTVLLSRDGSPRSAARPFTVTVPHTGARDVEVSAPTGTEPTIVQQVPIGASAPAALGGFVQLSYAVGEAAHVALRAQERLQGAGVARAQVLGDGDSLTAWVTGPQVGKARAALMPGVVTAYDWEQSVLTPGAGGEPLADAQQRVRQEPGTTRIVQALGRHGTLPARNDRRARFYVLRGAPALTDTPRLGRLPMSTGGRGAPGVTGTTTQPGAPAVTGTTTQPGAPPSTGAVRRPVWQLEFDAAHRGDLHRLTRSVSRRGQGLMLPGVSAASAAQHVALVLDGHLLTLVPIDPGRLPDGVRGNVLDLPPSFESSWAVRQAGVLQRGPLPPMRELR